MSNFDNFFDDLTARVAATNQRTFDITWKCHTPEQRDQLTRWWNEVGIVAFSDWCSAQRQAVEFTKDDEVRAHALGVML